MKAGMKSAAPKGQAVYALLVEKNPGTSSDRVIILDTFMRK
jgi:hypothetical protein